MVLGGAMNPDVDQHHLEHMLKGGKHFPNFYIIGEQKCSTTSLYDLFVNLHPEICHSSTKEIHYFDSPINWEKGAEYYVSHFKNGKCGRTKVNFIDSTPDYFNNPLTPERMSKSFATKARKHKKFVLVLRDPVQRDYSWYNHIMRHCVSHMHDFISSNPSTAKDVIAGKALWNVDKMCKDVHCHPLKSTRTSRASLNHEVDALKTFTEYWQDGGIAIGKSEYITHLQNWLKYFDREQFFIVNMGTLLLNTTDTVQRMTSFFNISAFPLSAFKNGEIELPHDNAANVETKFDCVVRDALYPHYEPYNQRLYELLNNRTKAEVTHEPPFPEFALKKCAPGQVY